MQLKTTLRVLGVDLGDDGTIASIASRLDDLVWSVVDGRVCAAVIVDRPGDLVCRVVEAARRIEQCLRGSRVDRADEELVGVSDIAARVKLNRETIRSWATGSRGSGDFPAPVGSIGGGQRGTSKIWRWAEVNDWLDKSYALGDGYKYATQAEFAEINAYLARSEYLMTAVVQNGPSVPSSFSNPPNTSWRPRVAASFTGQSQGRALHALTSQFQGVQVGV